jgi:hypothetical protein
MPLSHTAIQRYEATSRIPKGGLRHLATSKWGTLREAIRRTDLTAEALNCLICGSRIACQRRVGSSAYARPRRGAGDPRCASRLPRSSGHSGRHIPPLRCTSRGRYGHGPTTRGLGRLLLGTRVSQFRDQPRLAGNNRRRGLTTRVQQRRNNDQHASSHQSDPTPSQQTGQPAASSAITAPATVTEHQEGSLEVVHGVWRMRRDVATAAKRRPRLSV